MCIQVYSSDLIHILRHYFLSIDFHYSQLVSVNDPFNSNIVYIV